MNFVIKNVDRPTLVPKNGKFCAYLISDNWDDFGFKTSYDLIVFDEAGEKHDLGPVKIGYLGQKDGRTKIPESFTTLDETYFSLGQNTNYYEKISKFNSAIKDSLLKSLRDIVCDEKLLSDALNESVTGTSLLRDVSVSSVKGQYRRLLSGHAKLTKFKFRYAMPQKASNVGFVVDFHVDPESNPPTNIHVLIGRNGVGKTYLLNNMVSSLIESPEEDGPIGEFTDTSNNRFIPLDVNEIFAGVVSVSFSAFDPFLPRSEQKDKTKGLRYSYVGLKRTTSHGGDKGTPMSHDMLVNNFANSMAKCFAHGKTDIWKRALKTLESDPLFKEVGMSELADMNNNDEFERNAKSLFRKMSSGHEIVLLTITRLVEVVEEKTLVLIDEPEGHLHPPLLSAFIRALSDLLTYRNGVAIIATHSPVIVQEVPKSCVWKLRRTGRIANAERPEIETFGENVGILTREIFGLEVTESGYHQLLNKALSESRSYEHILTDFSWQLGSEAKSILRGLLADERNGEF